MPRRPTVDLGLVRTFVAVAQHGSISAAARELNLTQGGISQQVKRLEAFFECVLLERSPQGARLSPQGLGLLPQARQMLELNDSLYVQMTGAGGVEAVRVGVPHDMAGDPFAPVLKAYADRHPNAEVTIVTGSSVELMEAFSKGQVDLTLSQCPEGQGSGERLYAEPLLWIGAPGELFRQRPLPLCFVTPTCTFRRTAFSLLAQANIPWRVLFENASVDTTLSTIRSGLALTPWLRSLVPTALRVLDADAGLPALPHFVIELHVSQGARAGAMEMAQSIRQHYRQGVCARNRGH